MPIHDPEYQDALPGAPFGVRGRGAGLNPGNRYEGSDPRHGVIRRLHVLGNYVDHALSEPEETTQRVETEIIIDHTRTIINRVDSPDLPFQWTLNPYRGCEHGCVYCYARPDHERLGYSCGLDFETKIIAKPDAPRLLGKELSKKSWKAETIAMAGVTDCYQPIEKKLRITRQCLEVFAEARQPVGIVTKSRLILRDIDLLQELTRFRAVRIAVSITTLDHRLASQLEPRASSPRDRLHTVQVLADAGLTVVVMVAPIIPGLNDREIPTILRAAREAGAMGAGYILLRLPHQIKALFLDWLQRHFPERATHVESLVRQTQKGGMYDPTFGVRHRGSGEVARQIGTLFKTFQRKYKLDRRLPPLSKKSFRPPVSATHQPLLFD